MRRMPEDLNISTTAEYAVTNFRPPDIGPRLPRIGLIWWLEHA